MQEQGTEILSLIDRCKAGERKAQEQLYRQLYGFSMAITIRYSRDEADAAEILSHAFFKIFRSIKCYDQNKGIFHAWVRRIIINEAIDHIKSRNEFNELHIETDDEPTVTNMAVQNIGANEIMAEIQKLPPATHAVFVMYVLDGFNHREIAEQLQISAGTSKWHLSEARRFLQKRLSAEKNYE
jgi:RNA polymerase sigma factor (sigma-70 family)